MIKRDRFGFLMFGFVFLSFFLITLYLIAEFKSGISFNISSLTASILNSQPATDESYLIVPEYQQKMEKVVISLSKSDTTLIKHIEILINLPSYTQIIVLTPEKNLKTIHKEFRRYFPNRKPILVPYKTRPRNGASYYIVFPENERLVEIDVDNNKVTYGQGTVWARDLFVAARQANKKPLLLVPDIHKWFISYGEKSNLKVINDNSYLSGLASYEMDLVKFPITFQGGNIQIDIFKRKRIAFVGVNTLLSTRVVWKSTLDSNPSDKQIMKMLKEFFRTDEVIIIGKNSIQPPSLLFHLDQAMIILDEGIVGMTNIVGQKKYASLYSDEVKEVEFFLAKARKTLSQRGYRLIDIDTSVKNIVLHQQYVNAIPYVNRKNNRKSLLMPIFESSQTEYDKMLIKKNLEKFESLNYQVVPILTKADETNGGIHCLINVVL